MAQLDHMFYKQNILFTLHFSSKYDETTNPILKVESLEKYGEDTIQKLLIWAKTFVPVDIFFQ